MKFALFYEIPVARPWAPDSEHLAYKHTLEQAIAGAPEFRAAPTEDRLIETSSRFGSLVETVLGIHPPDDGQGAAETDKTV